MTTPTWTVVAAFAAGCVSSIGPCAAPRFLVIAAALAGGVRAVPILSFAGGSSLGCAAFAALGVAMETLAAGSHLCYAAVALAMLVGGIATLGGDGCRCAAMARPLARSAGAMFLFGLSTSIAAAPCCAPFAVAVGMRAIDAGTWGAAAVLVAFGAGHMLPVAAIAAVCRAFRNPVGALVPRDAPATVGGALMLGVGAFYGVLA